MQTSKEIQKAELKRLISMAEKLGFFDDAAHYKEDLKELEES